MRILMTGASGLLGQRIAQLAQGKHDIISLGRTHPRGLTEHVQDSMVGVALPEIAPVDAVIHLVQYDQFRNLPTGLSNLIAINVLSTARVLEWALAGGATRFILASSGAVYENPSIGSLADLGNIDTYASSRRSAELITSSVAALLDVVILRYFFIYGAGQDRRMLLPRIADRVLEGDPVRLDGHEGLVINPVHVNDAAQQTLAALTSPTGTYDVCGPEAVTLKRIAQICGDYVGRTPRFEYTSQSQIAILGSYRTEPLGPCVVTPRVGLRDVCPG